MNPVKGSAPWRPPLQKWRGKDGMSYRMGRSSATANVRIVDDSSRRSRTARVQHNTIR